MLHDLLLSLSLFSDAAVSNSEHQKKDALSKLELSPSDSALISSLKRLGETHRKLGDQLDKITTDHRSTISKAVAVAIRSNVLSDFQECVLQVESSVLSGESQFVAAYGVVPLSNVVRQFEPWEARLDWLVRLTSFVNGDSKRSCSGVDLLNWLRVESHTGYTDILKIATSLCQVAEKAWLRQLSSWVICGTLPLAAAHEFVIQQQNSNAGTKSSAFYVDLGLLPSFVTVDTAKSILFIGKSLINLQNSDAHLHEAPSTSRRTDNRSKSLIASKLANLPLPLSQTNVSSVIESIRLMVAAQVLKELSLPEKTMELLQVLRDFVLLGRGEFAVSLIAQAEKQTSKRHFIEGTYTDIGSTKGTGSVKEGQTSLILRQTWEALVSSTTDDEEAIDESLEAGRRVLRLVPLRASSNEPSSGNNKPSFDHFICGSPVALQVQILSPLDILFSQEDVQKYSSVAAYLLAIRRAHIKLSSMWQASALRKEHPSPLGPPHTSRASTREKIIERRQRWNQRMIETRKMWSICAAAVGFLSELGNYFQLDVISACWMDFQSWLNKSSTVEIQGQEGQTDSLAKSRDSQLPKNMEDRPSSGISGPDDPEAIILVHQYCVELILSGILMNDRLFVKSLHDLLRDVEHLSACSRQLETVWQSVDLEADEGVFDANNENDIHTTNRELRRVVERVQNGLSTLIDRLRAVNSSKGTVVEFPSASQKKSGFSPRNSRTLDRLLTKFDFSNDRSQ